MKRTTVFLFIPCFLFLMQNIHAQLVTGETVAVTSTESGKVRGYVSNGIATYKGIPYAEGKRFEVATKAKPWDGIRSSKQAGNFHLNRAIFSTVEGRMGFPITWNKNRSI